jgi:hypothetical protein
MTTHTDHPLRHWNREGCKHPTDCTSPTQCEGEGYCIVAGKKAAPTVADNGIEPCCGEFATCEKRCRPLVRELRAQLAATEAELAAAEAENQKLWGWFADAVQKRIKR